MGSNLQNTISISSFYTITMIQAKTYVCSMIKRNKWLQTFDGGSRTRWLNMLLNDNIVKKIQSMHMYNWYEMKEWQHIQAW